MAMDAGTVAPGGAGTGMAKELYDDYRPKLGDLGIAPGSITAEQQIADLCNSIAKVMVAHITDNAEVLTSVTTTVPAPIPVTTAVVLGVGTGATTAPGAGSGAGTGAAGSAVF